MCFFFCVCVLVLSNSLIFLLIFHHINHNENIVRFKIMTTWQCIYTHHILLNHTKCRRFLHEECAECLIASECLVYSAVDILVYRC